MATTTALPDVDVIDALVRAVHALREDAAARRLSARGSYVRKMADRDEYAAEVLEDVLAVMRRPSARRRSA